MVGIRIDGVTKLFGQTRAVDDVTVDIAQGELFFLLGPSGCGKTTLLRMIAGFYYPDGGTILFDDRDVGHVPPHQRHTGMVFQNYALWPHMTVRENVTFGLEMHRVSLEERQQRVDRALELVQMQEYAERSPNQLSGGQQQRVALARALVLEPDVVLLDEPLSNLDAKLRLEMRARIKEIHETLGLTMVYVTHDQAEALSMADRMAIMLRGRIAQEGTPREVYHRPQSRFIADFIGETNLIPGRVSAVAPQTTVDTAVGALTSDHAFAGARPGMDVWCSIRPENLDFLPSRDTGENRIEGQVLRSFFLGDHEQYFVRLTDGSELRAVEFDTGVARAAAGQKIHLGCDAVHVVVLPRDEEGGLA